MKNILVKSLKIGIFLTVLAGAFFAGATTLSNLASAQVINCDTEYTTPVFNPFPVTYGIVAGCLPEGPRDFPVVSAGISGSGSWSSDLNAQIGDAITLRVYIHNGAATGSGALNNVQYNTTHNVSADGRTHTFDTTLSASNASPISGSVSITIPEGATLQGDGLSGSIGDLEACFEFAQLFYTTLTVVGPTEPPVTPTASLTINDQTTGSFFVGDAWTLDLTTNIPNTPFTMCGTFPDGTQSCTPNWGTTDANGNWTQSGAFSSADVGTWFEHVEFPSNGVSSNEITFTVSEKPQVPTTLSASADAANYCVYSRGEQTNDRASYTVQGSANLANQKIVWSSTLNGVSTGEVNSYYGQDLDANAFWSGDADRTWNISDIGNWTKTANTFDGAEITASTVVSFTVMDCSTTPPPVQTASLTINDQTTGSFFVGDAWTLKISTDPVMANQPVQLCSKEPSPTGNSCTPASQFNPPYPAATDANGNWTVSGTFPADSVGSWIEYAIIGVGASAVQTNDINFTVAEKTGEVNADISVVKTANKTTANPGDTVIFTVTVSNGGPNIAANTKVTDLLPGGLTLVSFASSVGSYDPNTGVWTVGDLADGMSQALTITATVNSGTQGQTITNTAVGTSDRNDPDSGNNTGSVSVTVPGGGGGVSSADLQVTKTADRTTANPGDTLIYTITIINNGPNTAQNARISDVLPSALNLVSTTSSVGNYESGNGIWTIGNLQNGASATLTITTTVKAGTEGQTITNTAIGTSDLVDPDTTDNTDSVSVTVPGGGGGVSSADLAVSKTANRTTANVGDTLIYTIQITNNGPDNATGVSVSDVLPSSLDFVSATSSAGSYSTSTGVWTVGDLPDSFSAALTITTTIKSGTQGQTITNTAVGTSVVNDPNAANNTSSVSTTVSGGGGGVTGADLQVTKIADRTRANVGDTVTYTITVVNNGPESANNVRITDNVPSSLTLVSATSTSGSYSTSTGVWTVGDLADDASATLTLVATVNSGTQGQTITNTAVGTSDRNDPDSGNNTDSVDVVINTPGGGGGGGGGGSGGGGGGSISSRRRTPPLAEGEVLGATTCSYLNEFLKIDWPNDSVEVLKLQAFLNVFEGENLSLTGVYDQETFEAVARFQTKYSEDILEPWGSRVTTGFTYILTRKKVNEIFCSSPFPITSSQEEEIQLFRAGFNPPDRNVMGQIMGYPASYYYGQGSGAYTTPQMIEEESTFVPSSEEEEITDVTETATTSVPVVDLTDGSSGSVVKNAAISLLAIPGKILNRSAFLTLLLVLILVAIIMLLIRYFSGPDDSSGPGNTPILIKDKIKDKSNTPKKAGESPKTDDGSVIHLPGIAEGEEIIIENPDEEELK